MSVCQHCNGTESIMVQYRGKTITVSCPYCEEYICWFCGQSVKNAVYSCENCADHIGGLAMGIDENSGLNVHINKDGIAVYKNNGVEITHDEWERLLAERIQQIADNAAENDNDS